MLGVCNCSRVESQLLKITAEKFFIAFCYDASDSNHTCCQYHFDVKVKNMVKAKDKYNFSQILPLSPLSVHQPRL